MRFLRLFSILAALLFALPAARGGDMATVEVLGFSGDGGIFAFEEYGIQDGSGFPYANRYYIDTENDSFLPGTPIRVRLDEPDATLQAARQEARERGRAVVEDAALDQGFRAGWNAVTELSADPHSMAVNPRPVVPPIDDVLEFRLEELRLEQPEDCRDLGEVTVGFRLLRIATAPGGRTDLVHEDERIPSSRACPLGYRLTGVQTYHPAGAAPVFAVLIAIRRFGFEGPDHRFIAVTGRL